MSQQPESPSSSLIVGPAPLPGPASEVPPASPPEPVPAIPAGNAPGRVFQSAPPLDGPSHQNQHPPQRIPRWLVRIELFLRVLLRMYIGLAVCYAPWSHTFWDQNPIFLQYPTLSAIAANGAVRGIVSGLGLLNLWIAFHDAIRHRDG